MLNGPVGKPIAYPLCVPPDGTSFTEQPAPAPSTTEEPSKAGETGTKKSERDEAAKSIHQALSRQTQIALSALLEHIRQELEELLIHWEPDPKLSEEENLAVLQKLLQEAVARLSAEGQPLLMDEALEAGLLKALSSLLTARASGFLSFLGPNGPSALPEALLSGLFLRLTGTRPSPDSVRGQAAALLRNTGTASREIPHRLWNTGGPAEPGILYRRAGNGVHPEREYRAQVQANEHSARAVRPGPEAPRADGTAWAAGRDIRQIERFAREVLKHGNLPPEAAAYTSEERLGLDAGLVWLKAETAAVQPGTSPTAVAVIRDTAELFNRSVLYEAGRNLKQSARHGSSMAACPDLRLEDVERVRNVMMLAYKKVKSPERAVLEAVKYALTQYESKQEDRRFQAWLRYAPERGLFTAQVGKDDIRAGWKELCLSWNQFLRSMDLGGETAFREAAGFRSLWAMILSAAPQLIPHSAPTPAAVWGWVLGGASAAAAVCGIWYAQGAGRLGFFAVCLVLGGAALLLQKRQ